MERLERNFIWMAAANIAGSVFSVALFIYLARTLGAGPFGSFSYAQSFVFYLLNFVDLGLSTYGAREVAKDRLRVSEYVSEIVSFKLLLATILFAILMTATFAASSSPQFKLIMAGISLLLFAVALSCDWAFQGQEKLRMVFVSFVTTTFLQLALIYVIVKSPSDLLKTPFAYSIAALPIPILFLLHFKYKPKLKIDYLKQIERYLASSIIIWLIGIFAQVYNGLDIVLLGLFRKAEEVGYFTVAHRAIGGATLLMVFLANALLPRLSSTFGKDIKEFTAATHKFLEISAILVVFLVVPLVIFTDKLMVLALGTNYLPACLPFKIMAAGFVLVIFNLPYSTGLIAAGFEKAVLKQVFASACLNVICNLLLMPKYGMIGASISFLLAEALSLVLILQAYHRKIGIKASEYFRV